MMKLKWTFFRQIPTIFTSPESLISDFWGCDMLLSPIYQQSLVGVVDEAHVKK